MPEIAFLFYEDMTALDAIGPHEVLARLPGAEVRFVASTPGPKTTDVGMTLIADFSLEDVPSPDLVIYLQTPTDVLRKHLRERLKADPEFPPIDDEYVRELNEAYNHFFFHYSATPLLVVETSQMDLSWGDEAIADLERQLRSMGKGTRYYVPR